MEYRITICHDCLSAFRQGSNSKRLISAASTIRYPIRSFSDRAATQGPRPSLHAKDQRWNLRRARHIATSKKATVGPTTPLQSLPNLNAIHSRILELASSVLRPSDGPVPSEQRVLYVLEQLDAIAKQLADANSIAGAAAVNGSRQDTSATSALLGSVNTRPASSSVTKVTLLSLISQKGEEIIRHPNVFITPATLKIYVELQKLLAQPTSFPDVFELYASKPLPKANADGSVSYSPADPKKLNAAIDANTANAALKAAIYARDLPLALSIINTSFEASSFTQAKLLRQGAIPAAGLALAPAFAYGLSTQFGAWQTMLDPAQATTMAFAGIMTYVGAVAMVGYVAITTANDQMDRVTWALGVPLKERWLREEERAALDRIAGAWGFKDVEKRGDEEGEDWDRLREWIGRRGMVLDRVELMEGME